jgi:hypothetical protein
MSLFVDSTYKGSEYSKEYHVGESIQEDPRYVTAVQADGDELWLIMDTLDGLPSINKNKGRTRVVSWHGDFAKFIVANLILKK